MADRRTVTLAVAGDARVIGVLASYLRNSECLAVRRWRDKASPVSSVPMPEPEQEPAYALGATARLCWNRLMRSGHATRRAYSAHV